MTYFTWLFIFLILPTLILWTLYHKILLSYKKVVLNVVWIAFAVHTAWDFYAVSLTTWTFPIGHNIGIFIGNLPLEEHLFAILTPLLSVSFIIVTRTHLLKSHE